jgi:hypothetical protein
MDFSYGNPMWRYYQVSDTERSESGLNDLTVYLPEDNVTANRDIGSVQGGYFRFSAKHKDISRFWQI